MKKIFSKESRHFGPIAVFLVTLSVIFTVVSALLYDVFPTLLLSAVSVCAGVMISCAQFMKSCIKEEMAEEEEKNEKKKAKIRVMCTTLGEVAVPLLAVGFALLLHYWTIPMVCITILGTKVTFDCIIPKIFPDLFE